jgi:hypothetical protein
MYIITVITSFWMVAALLDLIVTIPRDCAKVGGQIPVHQPAVVNALLG